MGPQLCFLYYVTHEVEYNELLVDFLVLQDAPAARNAGMVANVQVQLALGLDPEHNSIVVLDKDVCFGTVVACSFPTQVWRRDSESRCDAGLDQCVVHEIFFGMITRFMGTVTRNSAGHSPTLVLCPLSVCTSQHGRCRDAEVRGYARLDQTWFVGRGAAFKKKR